MRRGVKTGVIGAILLGLLGLGAVLTWTALDNKVTVQVDGAAPRTIHTMSQDVRGALADAGFPLSAHDDVAPAANKSVREGLAIHLIRGRLLVLTVDGKLLNQWVAAATVGDALARLGFDTSAYSSLPASETLPLAPTPITVRTAKSVTLIRAGKSDSIESTAPSVGALLAEQGIRVGPNDMLSMPASTPLTDLMTITWKQVRHQTVTTQLSIPYDTTWQDDSSQPDGDSTVVTAGVPGSRTVTYDVLLVDGREMSRNARSDVVTAPPVTQVVSVGTKVEASPPAAQPAAAQSAAAPEPKPAATTAPKPATATATTPTSHPVATPTPRPVATPTPRPVEARTPPVVKPPVTPVTKPVAEPVKPVTPKPVAPKPVAPKPSAPRPAPPPPPKPAEADREARAQARSAPRAETGPEARANDRHRGDAGLSPGDRQVDDGHIRLEHHLFVQLPGQPVEWGERLAVECHQSGKRRLRHPAGLAGQQDGDGRSGLANQPAYPDQMGNGLHQGSLRNALRGLVGLAFPIAALVLTRAGRPLPE